MADPQTVLTFLGIVFGLYVVLPVLVLLFLGAVLGLALKVFFRVLFW